MSDEGETRRVVERLYEAYLAGDAAGMRAEMAEDVEVRFLGMAELSGLDAFRRFQEFAGGLLTDLDFRIRKVILDGEVAAVIWEETARTADGRPWESHGVDVIRVRGGRIVSLHENNDVTLVHRHFPRYVDSRATP